MRNVFKEFQAQHVLKQVIATAASGWLSVTAGIAFGFSAVLLPQLEKDENFPYDKDLATWIASITPLSMVLGCLGAGSLIDKLGRKTGHIVLAVICLISWFIIAFSTNNTFFLIGRFIAGLSVGSNKPVTLVYLGEITDPKYRSLTLVGPSFSLCLGILISHWLGGYISWRPCTYIYATANVSCLITLLFLHESPLWLISKGKIAEGVQAFKWFRGQGIEAEKELQIVLQRQNEKSTNCVAKDIMNISFAKPLFTVFMLACIQFNGTNVFSIYPQEILEATFKGSIDPFIFMLGLDAVRLVVLIVICAFNKFISRKMFFVVVSSCCSIVLFILVAYLYHIETFGHVWLSIVITVLYIGFGGCVVGLAWSFVPELFSANLRGLGSGIGAAISYFLLFVCVKVYPGFISRYGEVALYTTNGVLSVIITVILYCILPETNGRTLQEIEDSYKKSSTIVSTL